MTIIERYIHEIKEAGKYLEKHPDWKPDRFEVYNLQNMKPSQAIGEIVQGITED